uniref:Deltamethrin resistance protein prag01 domain-containing protein n=1 Tax=Strigamia maritima TaxID=126957 RepID=T1JL46_STRMM
MQTRILQRALPLIRRAPSRSTSYEVKDYKPTTMDDLPIPSGSWEKANNAKQMYNNILLGVATVFFAGSIVVGRQTGVLNFQTGPAWKNEK